MENVAVPLLTVTVGVKLYAWPATTVVAGVPDTDTVTVGDVVPVPPEPEPLVPVPEPLVPVPEPLVPVPEPLVPVPEPLVPVPEPAVPEPDPAVPEPDPAVLLPLLPAVLPVVLPEGLVAVLVLEATPALPPPPHPASATETNTIIVPENNRRDVNVRMVAPRPGTIPWTSQPPCRFKRRAMVARGTTASVVPALKRLPNHWVMIFFPSRTGDTRQWPSAGTDGNLKRLQRSPAQHPELPINCGKFNPRLIRSHRVPQIVTREFLLDITSNTCRAHRT